MKLRFCFWIMIMMAAASSMADPDSALQREAHRQTESIRQGAVSWPTITTRFFKIHHQPMTRPDSTACLELDAFLEKTLGRIDVSGKIVDIISNQKLNYYLCDDATVARLTGYQTKGMADLSGRAVISSHFPHFHELAHLLVDITIPEVSLQTHPLLQEGIACLLGGRWGRAPDTILYTGWIHRNFGMGKLEDVMTRDAFFTFGGGPDVTYPMAAMLCEVVRREAGWSGVMRLYAELSGSVEFVASLSEEDVLKSVAEVCGWPPDQAGDRLDEAMNLAWSDYRRCGISPWDEILSAAPGREISLPGGMVRMWKQEDGCVLQFSAGDYPVFLVSKATSTEANSSVFSDNLVHETYHGQRYGLRCSPDNISLYDFMTNQLLATWVAGFTNEAGACNNQNNSLVFRVAGSHSDAIKLLMYDGCQLLH